MMNVLKTLGKVIVVAEILSDKFVNSDSIVLIDYRYYAHLKKSLKSVHNILTGVIIHYNVFCKQKLSNIIIILSEKLVI